MIWIEKRSAGRVAPAMVVLAGLLLGAGGLRAQQGTGHGSGAAGGGQGNGVETPGAARRAGMGRVAGEVLAVNGPVLTMRATDGNTVQVVTTDNTRVMKADGPVRVSDLHVGDGLMAMGNMDEATHTLHAGLVMAEDASQIKAMRENLGKTYITGRVTAINLDDAKMTVERPDHVAQTIGFDESTSFKRAVRPERNGGEEGAGGGAQGGGQGGAPGAEAGRRRGSGFGMMGDPSAMMDRAFSNGESITLADIKVGDFVMGTGAVKAGTFVPSRMVDRPSRPHRQGSGAAPGDAPGGAAPAAGTGPEER